MIGCCAPHQHNGFLPDLLGLDCLLVLTTCRSDAEQSRMGRREEVKTEWERREECKVHSEWKREAEEKSQEIERGKKAHIVRIFMSAGKDCLA